MHGPPRGVLQRIGVQAFQAECRGFETLLPLHFPFCTKKEPALAGPFISLLPRGFEMAGYFTSIEKT
jgi:hypothetical protein